MRRSSKRSNILSSLAAQEGQLDWPKSERHREPTQQLCSQIFRHQFWAYRQHVDASCLKGVIYGIVMYCLCLFRLDLRLLPLVTKTMGLDFVPFKSIGRSFFRWLSTFTFIGGLASCLVSAGLLFPVPWLLWGAS